jgi:hypothetical protein
LAFTAAAFVGRPEFGNVTDAAGVAAGLQAHAGRLPGVLFAIGLIDASLIGVAAVSLSTAYAIGDVLSIRHSLHRTVTDAKGFYAVYCGLIVIAAGLVLTPNAPLGLLTNAVQTLAGVLLPSATVFLLLLCNDKEVVGPWANTRGLNLFTGVVIAVLVMLSVILTVSVLFPDKTNETVILAILAGGSVLALIAAIASGALRRLPLTTEGPKVWNREMWRMPPLSQLRPAQMPRASRIWMIVLRGYLVLAGGLVLVRIIMLAMNN